jgi:hypothetical protein
MFPGLSRLRAERTRLLGLERSAPEEDLAEQTLRCLRAEPTLPMTAAGLTPDPWQAELIACPERQIAALCTRRSGKTRTVAARITGQSLLRPWKTLIFAPTEDQSKELLGYVREMNEALGCPVPLVSQTESRIRWANGSEVRAKADVAKSSRGFTPNAVVIDEAAQVSDELYLSVLPMLVLGRCEILALTTPYGKQGWFFDAWETPEKRAGWKTFTVTAYQCPRVNREVLEEHKATMPPRWFAQEYLCEFNDAIDAVFGKQVIESAVRFDDAFMPLAL